MNEYQLLSCGPELDVAWTATYMVPVLSPPCLSAPSVIDVSLYAVNGCGTAPVVLSELLTSTRGELPADVTAAIDGVPEAVTIRVAEPVEVTAPSVGDPEAV